MELLRRTVGIVMSCQYNSPTLGSVRFLSLDVTPDTAFAANLPEGGVDT
jgi:hypothetical protein